MIRLNFFKAMLRLKKGARGEEAKGRLEPYERTCARYPSRQPLCGFLRTSAIVASPALKKGSYLSPASVLVYALGALSIILFLTQLLMRNVLVNTSFMKTIRAREQAQMLALGGVQLAMAQLLYPNALDTKKKNEASSKEDDKKKDPDESLARYLGRVLPHINRWQEFKLTDKIDGIDGLIKICITKEAGKININQAFDFKKMAFKKEYEMLLKRLVIPGKVPAGGLYTGLTDFLKTRKRPVDDISQLLSVKGLDTLDIFYKPPPMPTKKNKSQSNGDLALQDIFTTWTTDDKLDLLWLSDGLCAILDIRRPHADDAVARRERFKQFQESFKKDAMGDWDTNWKIAEPIYDQKPKMIADLKNLFTKEFGPKVFSVLSCGKAETVEQYMLAVIQEEQVASEEQKKSSDDKQQSTGQKPDDDKKTSAVAESKTAFKILRAYWL